MRAKCISNVSGSLADHQRGRSPDREMRYDLTVGKEYVVVAMALWESVLDVLVRDDWGGPLWCPAGLFDLDAQPLPADWNFRLHDGLRLSGREAWGRCMAMWGYREIIANEHHSDELQDRDAEALAIFETEYLKAGGEPDGPEEYTGPWPGWPTS